MRQLAEITQLEIKLISSLQAFLEEELGVLKHGDATALPTIGEKKQAVISELNALEAKRATILGSQPGNDTKTAMEAWLNKHPDQQRLAADWKTLLGLARQAKTAHEINNKLVHMHLQQTNELLAALTNPAQQNALYGSDGQAAPASGSRIVDSA